MLKGKPLTYIFVRDDTTCIRISQTALDFRQEVQTLHDILDRGVRGELVDGIEDLLLQRWINHTKRPWKTVER